MKTFTEKNTKSITKGHMSAYVPVNKYYTASVYSPADLDRYLTNNSDQIDTEYFGDFQFNHGSVYLCNQIKKIIARHLLIIAVHS